MKLIVMSDSHGNDQAVEQVIKTNPDADYFIHCGDLCTDKNRFPQLILVKGNCDYDYSMPITLISDFNGVRFYITHSDRLGWNRKERLAGLARANDCGIALFGHTHVPDDEIIDGVRLLNPGSLFYNRDNSELGYLEIEIDSNKNIQVSRKLL